MEDVDYEDLELLDDKKLKEEKNISRKEIIVSVVRREAHVVLVFHA